MSPATAWPYPDAKRWMRSSRAIQLLDAIDEVARLDAEAGELKADFEAAPNRATAAAYQMNLRTAKAGRRLIAWLRMPVARPATAPVRAVFANTTQGVRP